MNDKLKGLQLETLIHALGLLHNEEEISNFLEDLCTINELKAMMQRLAVAILLDKGEQYAKIVQETGASTATISRVNRALMYGSDGYRTVLDRLAQQEKNENE